MLVQDSKAALANSISSRNFLGKRMYCCQSPLSNFIVIKAKSRFFYCSAFDKRKNKVAPEIDIHFLAITSLFCNSGDKYE